MTQVLRLSDLTVDFDDFVAQMNAYLSQQQVWKGQLTTQTSQTLVELAATVGVHDNARLIRFAEDAFSETAIADEAILSITAMQGLRITRMLPAQMQINLTSAFAVTIPPYTQFTVGGTMFFNREQLDIAANQTINAFLAQGQVFSVNMFGKGTPYQAWVSEEDSFVVSDVDTIVRVNGAIIPKTAGTLWNYRGLPAYADLTLPDGRLNVQFGNAQFGSMPRTQDRVTITYVITNGQSSNALQIVGRSVNVTGFPQISGKVLGNPTGGAPQNPVQVYKNVASGAFGTYESAVTRNQYVAIASAYPGIVDAITQAQREINPMALQWMNVVRVSILTNSPWTQQQQKEYLDDLQARSMYAVRLLLVDAQPIDRDVDIDVYAFNTATLSQVQALSEQAIQNLFAPKPNILMTDFFESDMDTAIKKANNGQISYIIVNQPVAPMYVNAPPAADTLYQIIPGGGTLGPNVYAYSVAVTNSLEEGPPNKWVFPQVMTGADNAIQLTWNEVPGAISYRIYGRIGGSLGQLGPVIPAVAGGPPRTFVDNGSLVPTGGMPNTLDQSPIRYNRLRSLTIRAHYADRQARLSVHNNTCNP